MQEQNNPDKPQANNLIDTPPSDQTLRTLTNQLKTTVLQVKQMHAAIPKQDFFKRLSNSLLLLFIGIICGIALIIRLPELLPIPNALTVSGGLALAAQDQMAVIAWGKESKEFIDCIATPDNDKKEKLCSMRIHYNNS